MTPDGETFLDVQLAPNQAEAFYLAEQSGTHCEEHEAMNSSASTSNVVEYWGNFKSSNMFQNQRRSSHFNGYSDGH